MKTAWCRKKPIPLGAKIRMMHPRETGLKMASGRYMGLGVDRHTGEDIIIFRHRSGAQLQWRVDNWIVEWEREYAEGVVQEKTNSDGCGGEDISDGAEVLEHQARV